MSKVTEKINRHLNEATTDTEVFNMTKNFGNAELLLTKVIKSAEKLKKMGAISDGDYKRLLKKRLGLSVVVDAIIGNVK